MRPRLLVLGAGRHRDRAFFTWARMGLDVTLAGGFSSAAYDFSVNDYLPMDTRDRVSPDLDMLCKLAGNHDGITTLADECQMTAAAVAERLGMPGAGLGAARLARDKAAQRARAHDRGLPGVRHLCSQDPEAIAEFVAAGGQPCVVKPTGSGGSGYVTFVESRPEAIQACKRVRQAGYSDFLAEEYLTGPEISVEAVVRNGELSFHSLTGKETIKGSFLECGHLVLKETQALAEGGAPEESGEISRLLRAMIDLFGLQSAVLHLEVKLTGRGAMPVEMAVRPAGDLIPELVEKVHGVNLYKHLACLALGTSLPSRRPDAAPLPGAANVRFGIGLGRVADDIPAAQITAGLPLVRSAIQLVPRGAEIQRLSGNWDRATCAVGWADDAVNLTGQLKDAVARHLQAIGLRPC